jgi:hypothetical protein
VLHFAFQYQRSQEMLDRAAAFLLEGFRDGEAIVAMTVPARRRALEAGLGEAAGHLRWHDAASMVADYLAKGEASLRYQAEAVVAQALRASPRVRIYGEVAEVLVHQGAWEEALALERLWDDLAQAGPVRLLCAYSSHDAARPEAQAAWRMHAVPRAGGHVAHVR